MDTNRIKHFATEARNILKAGIAAKITTLGFDKNGNVAEENKPLLMQGGSVWNGQLQTEGFYHQWMALYNRIQQIGIKDVYEEAAYTWFNRLCAIRILQKNNLCTPVLAYADAARTPVIVDEARQGRIPLMKEEMRQRLAELLDDDTKVTEQFAILITAWCHDNPIINQCFGSIADYTELLLPNNILAEGGFVDQVNNTEFITDDDFKSPELIGWLYQFYISERKDEVFAKKGKFEADEIPAATQIFTPNWIVKYMVQNTVGRIYLDNNPYETQLQKKWRYLVPIYNLKSTIYNSETQEPSVQPIINSKLHTINYSELEDLKVGDLACGSGHILNECFDLLYDLYIAEGYGRSEAVENIFSHNLTGIDLDTRAKQLSQFALLLKACQKDAAFADAHVLPNVLDMTGVVPALDKKAMAEACLQFVGGYEDVAGEMLEEDFELLKEADNLGSIMIFNNDENYLNMLRSHYEDWTKDGTDDCPANIKQLLPGVKVILALTEHYHALVMNPPYMGGAKMNSALSKYVKDNYEAGKTDLFSVFMQMGMERLISNGKMAQINMQSWMFLSSFEKLRTQFLKDYNIDSMLHLGPRTFDELSGEVVQNTAFVLSKHEPAEQGGVYYRLVDGKNCADKERLFLEAKQGDGKAIINSKLYPINYPNVEQKNFEKIPGCPIGYWVSEKMISAMNNTSIGSHCKVIAGLCTGDNGHYIFNWHEVDKNHTYFPNERFTDKTFKFHNKGGGSRKWYGNQDYIVKYSEQSLQDLQKLAGFRNDGNEYFYKASISWAKIASTYNTFRYYPQGFVFDSAGSSIFSSTDVSYTLLGFCNSVISREMIHIINPTINASPGIIKKLPTPKENEYIDNIVSQNIAISKQDWDAHETSWDFQRNELLSIDANTYTENINYEIEKHFEETGEHICIDPAAPQLGSLEWRMEQYKTKWERKFMQLHKNEEELNRQFIDIYGLQDELTPDVPLNEITILQQGEISINL
ncbi:BREX-1 system adenine-specific DNA-methyltransferase PglX [uncultured Prevotella sp.]|uniref:BREX-1 system adenine-specific DNA-methyltransferase PglX n=1 Tax=uncultured Prevotella sp. TaxID=159272 RepID=UPI0025864F1A|nr:BREX-1 system adenine-specific DNA-methyltransferase PglX [uncultured Prevotella sp.]